jgi:hypothetical protein
MLISKLSGPASESQKGFVLTTCLIVMAALCVGVVWQAQIIANQRDDIKWLQAIKLGQ